MQLRVICACIDLTMWLRDAVLVLKSKTHISPLLTMEPPVAQWLEHPTRSRRVVGSNPIWSSEFFSEFPIDVKNLWRCPQCCLATVKNKVWMTSDKGNVARQQMVGKQTGVSSLLEQNWHTSGKFCVQCRIKFQVQCSSIFTGWKYLCRIFSLSSRNLFCERLHWRNYTFCGRGKIIFRGK